MQTLIPLTEGQLKITESKFYRISGESTQHRGVVPDVTFPALYDHDEIGESSLDHALNWDQINPVRHQRYNDLSSVVPRVTARFVERSAGNPDFVYLEDQVELARQTRKSPNCPQRSGSHRPARKPGTKGPAIENKRRKALGKPCWTPRKTTSTISTAMVLPRQTGTKSRRRCRRIGPGRRPAHRGRQHPRRHAGNDPAFLCS